MFTRGNVLIAVSNGKSGEITITSDELKNGDKYCNMLKDSDCVTVIQPELKINMKEEPKIYVREEGALFIKTSMLFLILIFAF